MPTFATIRAGIAAIIAADSDLNTAGQVFEYEPNIAGIEVDPWVSIVASDNESEFETTSENKRTYNFIIRIFVERKQRGEAAAETLLTAIVDRLIQQFDENYTLGVSGVLLTKATPSSWFYALAEKEYRAAEIKLSTVCSVDVTP